MGKQVWQCEECDKVYSDKFEVEECEKKHEARKKEIEEEIAANKQLRFSDEVKLNDSAFDTHGGGVEFKIPKDCDAIILMGNRGGGLEPYQLLLPHQVYVKDLRETIEEEGFEVIVMVPVKSKDYLNIVYEGKYAYDRWKRK